jgi:hypothetical protein
MVAGESKRAAQKRAVAASSARSGVVAAVPIVFTSSKSCAYRALDNAGGGAGRKADGDVIDHGVIVCELAGSRRNARRRPGRRRRRLPKRERQLHVSWQQGSGDVVARAPGQNRLGDRSSPLEATGDSGARAALPVVGERCERRGKLIVECRLLRGEERDERRVCGTGSRRGSRGAARCVWRQHLRMELRIPPRDAVDGIEDGCLDDRADPSAGLGCCARDEQRIDERPVPVRDHVGGRRTRDSESDRRRQRREDLLGSHSQPPYFMVASGEASITGTMFRVKVDR